VREFEKATDYVIGEIRAGHLTLGSEIPSERQISAELGISRNSVREGLRTLENMGVIESRHGSGNYISGRISDSVRRAFDAMILLQRIDMKEISDYRKSTELAVYDMAFANPDKTEELRRISELLDGFMGQPMEERIRRDSEFHYTLVKMAHNRVLSMVMNSISEVYSQWVRQVLEAAPEKAMGRLHEAHGKIFESFIHNDRAAGIAAIADHYCTIEMMAGAFSEDGPSQCR
jgi:GntR family transcriptional repressor for pyruvate dehydrogenase complex